MHIKYYVTFTQQTIPHQAIIISPLTPVFIEGRIDH
jgi:hypothetical protein